MSETQPPKPRPRLTERMMFAVPAAAVYSLLLYLMIWGVRDAGDGGVRLPFVIGLVLLPMAVASLASLIADPHGQVRLWLHIKLGWAALSVGIIVSIFLFAEGGICIVMGAPFFYGSSAIGSAITYSVLRERRLRRSASVFVVLPLLAMPMEERVSYAGHFGAVTTVIDIAAGPAKVWQHTVAIPAIAPAELPFTFSHAVAGAPQPVDAWMEGEGPGAVRHLRWTRGVSFEEVVTRWEPERFLAWDFRFSPHSIPAAVEAHINVDSAYLKIASGDYTLMPLADGRTRLTLTTRYRIATPFNGYCDWWAGVFLNDFHRAVLTVIRARAEAAAG